MANIPRSTNVAAARRLLNRIVSTVEVEPDYDDAEALMVRYVDDQLAGRDTGDAKSRLDAHLRQCPESADMLSVLEDLASHESGGTWPLVDELWSELASACRPSRVTDRVGASVPRPGPLADLRPGPRPDARPGPRPDARPGPRPDARPGPPRPFRHSVPRDEPGAGLLDGIRRGLGSLFPRPLVAVPAMLLALLAVTSVGWWHADGRATENGMLMETVAGATSMRFNEMGGGAWARVAFDPDDSHALVWAGGLPSVSDGETYECWFARHDGERVRARALECFQGDPALYHLETDKLVESFDRFVMTREPQGDVVVEVALHNSRAQP